MTAVSVKERVKRAIANAIERDVGWIRDDAALADILVDSVHILEVAGDLEREYQIKINDGELYRLQTLPDFVRLVEHLIATKAAPG